MKGGIRKPIVNRPIGPIHQRPNPTSQQSIKGAQSFESQNQTTSAGFVSVKRGKWYPGVPESVIAYPRTQIKKVKTVTCQFKERSSHRNCIERTLKKSNPEVLPGGTAVGGAEVGGLASVEGVDGCGCVCGGCAEGGAWTGARA